MTAPYRLNDAELEDMKTTVHVLRETIQSISLAQGWAYLTVEQRCELWSGREGWGVDALPALRRTFLLLEER